MDPIQRQREVIGEIASAHVMYANVQGLSTHEGTKVEEVSQKLRKMASDLRATLWTIPFYRFWAFLHLIPKKDNIKGASSSLIGWHNLIFARDLESMDRLTDYRKRIRVCLGLDKEKALVIRDKK